VEQLLGFLRVVPITGSTRAVEEDPDDDKVIECALVAGASHIVSGDRHLLRLESFRGVSIQTPAAFLTGISPVTSTNPS
jgi:predicted nucleic acid-binding protein